MRSLTLQSPAKLNLCLRVVGRYPDGYHKLVTLFHRISLKDTLRLTKRKKGFSLRCSHPGLPTDKTNLIARAYLVLKEEVPDLKGVSVRLTKRIPVGGGLGGGSSNAAAFLLGMKRLYRLPLSFTQLIGMGKKLGADVPFFLYDKNQAIGTERGDKIYPRPARRKKWFLLVLFHEGLSTKKVYQNLPRKLPAASLTKITLAVRLTCKNLDGSADCDQHGLLQNDLEQSAFRLNPKIQKVISKIGQLRVSLTGMSGSGPTVFALLSHKNQARRLKRQLSGFLSLEKLAVCHTF